VGVASAPDRSRAAVRERWLFITRPTISDEEYAPMQARRCTLRRRPANSSLADAFPHPLRRDPTMIALLLASVLQQPPRPAPLQVVVTPSQPTVVVGDSLRLRGEVRDAAGRPVPGATVRWLGGGGFEGRVDSLGVVHAGSPGTLVVFAVPAVPGATPGEPTEIPVRMVPGPAARVTLAGDAGTLVVGQRTQLEATARSANGDVTGAPVIWSSSAPAALSVSRTGQLQALAPGRAVITAAAGGVRATREITVVAGPVQRVDIGGGAEVARTGDVLRFTASARDPQGRAIEGVRPTWTIAPGSGRIDPDGGFVAYEPGVYTVSASFGSAAADATVRVTPRDVRRETETVARVPVSGLLTAEFWPHPNGRNAYLSTVGDRVYALDISDPANVRVTDSVMVDARHINDVMATADGRWAVLTRENASSRRNGIVVLSLEDPAHPRVASEFTETVTGGVHSAFVYTHPRFGTHVYLTDDATGSMRVIDLNDPLNPRQIARWETPRGAGRMLHDIDVQDGLAYLSYWNDGLVILDVGNGRRGGSPSSPQLVSQHTYDLESLYRDVEAEGGPGYIRGTHTAWRHGNYVFVGDEVFTARPIGLQIPGFGLGKANGRLHVIDVSDIENPRPVAYYEPRDGGVHNVWVAGDTLLVGDYQGGLRVVDISGELRGDLLAQGREIAHVFTGDSQGHIPNAAMAWGAFYQNGIIWVNDMFSGLWGVRLLPKPARPLIPD
jgi:hypothetical protein